MMSAIFFNLILILISLSAAITTTIFLASPIYQLFNQWQDLASPVGLSYQQLMMDFDGMMHYLQKPWQPTLSFVHFSASSGGLQHFAEVKNLIQANLILSIIGLVLLSIYIFRLNKTQAAFYRQASKLSLIFPLVFLALMVMAFDQVFYWFHRVFFRNDLWLFDPTIDPIINVLPSQLFMLYFFIALIGYWLWVIYFRSILNLQKQRTKKRKSR